MERRIPDEHPMSELVERLREVVEPYWQGMHERPVAVTGDPSPAGMPLPRSGLGLDDALRKFADEVEPGLSASPGPRYLGFVTGGVTPAALLGDWIAAAVDQNVMVAGDSIAPAVERQTLRWLTELFGLPDGFDGVMTTGATASNLLGLLCGRQAAGRRNGTDIAREGMTGERIEVLAATPHASTVKVMGICGLGRDRLRWVAALPGREAMDPAALDRALADSEAAGRIVVASAGTVTGTDFDDLEAVAAVCRRHGAWLHVDGAFGLFARLLPDRRHWLDGLELADSITVDAHKWLNVPYDCGVFLTRHPDLLRESCSAAAPYLETDGGAPDYMHLGVENSRRFRALPVWLSLLAYGREGMERMVRAGCERADRLARWLEESSGYELLTPCRLNVVLFRPRVDGLGPEAADARVRSLLTRINAGGEVFMTPGRWQGKAAIRAAFSNWRTTAADVERVCALLARHGAA